ncbi:hypothetical protein [Mesorhizobium australicum]|uniref:hypothetical protein n=1 Tax=Mesorhizobium australicum TaxID=536018 RepID=UPI003EC01179
MIEPAEHAVAAAKTAAFRADRTLRLFSSRHHPSRYPEMTVFDFRPTLNAPDDGPYLWLEDVEVDRTLAWAASQSARTLGHLGGTQFDRDHDALTAIFDRPDKVPLITRRGQYLYNFWQDAGNPRALWRRDHPCCLSADPARHHETGRPGPPGPRE